MDRQQYQDEQMQQQQQQEPTGKQMQERKQGDGYATPHWCGLDHLQPF
jgi:hypothetical protein